MKSFLLLRVARYALPNPDLNAENQGQSPAQPYLTPYTILKQMTV
jgi:hypothetical protein